MRFYVYELADPATGRAFYVGKGQKGRVHQHEAEAARGGHSRKCSRIREIWARGQSVERRIVSRHSDENEALQAEFDLIATYGLEGLTNVMPGGTMGAKAYMARLAEAEARNAERELKKLRRGFVRVAPQMAMALRARAGGHLVGAWVGERWLDFTEPMYELLLSLRKKLGHEFVAATLAPHGVVLRKA